MSKEVDEDLIEATIRRVAESKAARETPPVEMPVAEAVAPEIVADSYEATPQEAVGEEDDLEVMPPTPILAATRGRGIARALAAVPRPSDPPRLEDAGITAQLEEITRRLDAMMAMLDQLTRSAAPSIGPAWEKAQADSRAAVPAQPPNVFRDPPARSAAAESDPEVIDTRPIPKPLPPLQVEPKRGFDLLPRSYRITVEDKRRGVDLVPLHRALLSMDGVRDMSLLSYNNGIAIVALETIEELDPDALGVSVSRAMSRGAKVEVHNEHTMVVKLADE